MLDEAGAKKRFSMGFLLPRCLGLFAMVLPPLVAIRMPELIQNSDYLTAFYVAGRAVLQGTPTSLYPAIHATEFFTTAFNALAHQTLPYMPSASTAIYMYAPLVALIFAPLSAMPPAWSMVVWQLLSIASVGCVTWLIAGLTTPRSRSFFWFAFLFLPVFQTLLIGQLGLVFGLLPLVAGFALLMRHRDTIAGSILALSLLKPQFLPAAMLLAGALALSGRWRCALGLVGGAVVISALMVVCLGQETFTLWLHSFRLSDTIFSNPAYNCPRYLVTCMPGLIVQSVPSNLSNVAKLASYGMAGLVGLHALWTSVRLLKVTGTNRALPFIFILGMFVLPLVVPHFLFYDLCCLAAAGMVAFGFSWPQRIGFVLRTTCILAWLVLNAYDLMFMSPLLKFAHPAIVVITLVLLYLRLLLLANQNPVIDPENAVPTEDFTAPRDHFALRTDDITLGTDDTTLRADGSTPA